MVGSCLSVRFITELAWQTPLPPCFGRILEGYGDYVGILQESGSPLGLPHSLASLKALKTIWIWTTPDNYRHIP